MTALVIGKVVDELEKLRCQVDITRGLIFNLQQTWTPELIRMAGMNMFVQEFIGRLEEESGIHSRIPQVFDPKTDLYGPNQQADIEQLEELYGDGPEDGPRG